MQNFEERPLDRFEQDLVRVEALLEARRIHDAAGALQAMSQRPELDPRRDAVQGRALLARIDRMLERCALLRGGAESELGSIRAQQRYERIPSIGEWLSKSA
jgi:hypothetical protein